MSHTAIDEQPDGPLPARCYVIDRDGLATLCKDADDAQDVAAAARVQWPNRGPYRVALLGDVAAVRSECAELLKTCAESAWREGSAEERERWKARVEEAFRDGFYSPRTYNDTVLNTAADAWEEAKAGLLKA
jgi:hypothetical protein